MAVVTAQATRGRAGGARPWVGRAVRLLPVIVCLLIGWMLFAPTAVGGPATYVITDGTSMLPHFRAEGLVITRRQPAYQVGEVVAYHNPLLHTIVMHRIVARQGDRYVFQGDNNDFQDRYHATRSDLIGKEWIYWPGAGRYLGVLRNPLAFGGMIGLITLASFLLPPGRTSRRRRRRHHV